MKTMMFLLVAVFLIGVPQGMSEARINPLKQDKLVSFSDERYHASAQGDELFNDLHIGALWFPAVSNKGYIGFTNLSAFYPGGGDQSIIWQAGMWGGGYVEGRNLAWWYQGSDGFFSDPANYDTLGEQAVVETEADFGYPYPYRRLTVHVNTAAKPESGDGADGDMGMDVTYQWHQWGVAGYDHWVFVHVTIEFSNSIDGFWWGWMSDCDVGDVNVTDVNFDDFAGWDETHRFSYMRDWDYDPLPGQPAAATAADSLWLSTGVLGQILLAAPPVGEPITDPPDPAQKWVSKNYWDWNNEVTDRQNAYDRLTGEWENPFPSLDDFDYRILNGVGPYNVSLGDVAHFWMAYVVGEGYDDDSHSTFGLGTLREHVEAAQDFFDGGMVIPDEKIPPQIPDLDPDLEGDVVADELHVHWAPYNEIFGGTPADSFIVYTSTISKLGPWHRYDAFGSSVTETTVKLIPGFYTYVWVQAYNEALDIGSNPWALSSRLYAHRFDSQGKFLVDWNTIISAIGNTATEIDLNKITVAPNPYVGSNEAELSEYETLLGFHHLPERCTIYIYNLLGNLVDIIHHNSPTGSEYWDMTTRSRESISSGLYIYRVRDEFGNEKVGKFAVIKGQR